MSRAEYLASYTTPDSLSGIRYVAPVNAVAASVYGHFVEGDKLLRNGVNSQAGG